MSVYVSLLRGINVGGNKLIKMDRLKALYETLGFASVQTLLNSGNVVFAAKEKDRGKFAGRIEDAIDTEFGFRPAVMLRDAPALARIVAKNPYPDRAKNDPSRLAVMFLATKPDEAAPKRLADAYDGPEDIRVAGEEAYLYYPNGFGRSKLTNVFLEKQLGVTGTARNWNTVAKLLALTETIEN
jgi:uncharacterized protein (DUF1697 family)